MQERGRCDVDVLAAKLARLGYRVAVRTALGGGHGQNCFQVTPDCRSAEAATVRRCTEVN